MNDDTKQTRAALVVGASSGVGRALAGRLAAQGYDLVLSARGQRDLDAVAADARLRFGTRVLVVPTDLGADDFDPSPLLAACESLGRLDALLVPAGLSDDGDTASGGAEQLQWLTRINYISAAAIAMAAVNAGIMQHPSRIVFFSSIAARAPRTRNACYGAAKAALGYYAAALRHELAGTGIDVQVYALGYVDTRLSFGKKLLFPVAAPEQVADHVVRRLRRGGGLAYFPSFWRWVTLALSWLPWPLYKRLNF